MRPKGKRREDSDGDYHHRDHCGRCGCDVFGSVVHSGKIR